MGGRGSWSLTSGGRKYSIQIGDASSSEDVGKVDDTPEGRADIIRMFGDVGVTSVGGTQGMPTNVLGAVGIQLNNLERKYGAIGASESVKVMTADGVGFKSAVGDIDGHQVLILSPRALSSVRAYNKQLRHEQSTGFKMPTDGTVLSNARYTTTHEYGHILQNAMYQRAKSSGYTGTKGQYAGKVAREVARNAVKRFGGSQSDLSEYGATNSQEFFAEAFANANLGNPNPIGKAMADWLSRNRM